MGRFEHVVLLSLPGLRSKDLAHMPSLASLVGPGDRADLAPSFPAVTCPVQINMTTGKLPREHGVVANGFYWRDRQQVEMWTAWNDSVRAPQIWDLLHQHDAGIRSAAWFGLLTKGCGADFVCTPAPVHNPDGSESLWCYTKPTELYGELRDALGHFPLQHFWGPAAGIPSSAWIARSAVHAAQTQRPNFFYIYLPHLDYAAQKEGPDSDAARRALQQLDGVIVELADGMTRALGQSPLWIVASEYAISPVSHVTFPNRMLREAGLLSVRREADGEHLDLNGSRAWALVDHQFSHVFVRDAVDVGRVVGLFKGREGFAEALCGEELARYGLDHERSGAVVLVSSPESWQAYYWWLYEERAPGFARTVDIHRKPGYDPVELFLDDVEKCIPLDAGLVRGSHGAPPRSRHEQGAILTSVGGVLPGGAMKDIDVCRLVLEQFGA